MKKRIITKINDVLNKLSLTQLEAIYYALLKLGKEVRDER